MQHEQKRFEDYIAYVYLKSIIDTSEDPIKDIDVNMPMNSMEACRSKRCAAQLEEVDT